MCPFEREASPPPSQAQRQDLVRSYLLSLLCPPPLVARGSVTVPWVSIPGTCMSSLNSERTFLSQKAYLCSYAGRHSRPLQTVGMLTKGGHRAEPTVPALSVAPTERCPGRACLLHVRKGRAPQSLQIPGTTAHPPGLSQMETTTVHPNFTI